MQKVLTEVLYPGQHILGLRPLNNTTFIQVQSSILLHFQDWTKAKNKNILILVLRLTRFAFGVTCNKWKVIKNVILQVIFICSQQPFQMEVLHIWILTLMEQMVCLEIRTTLPLMLMMYPETFLSHGLHEDEMFSLCVWNRTIVDTHTIYKTIIFWTYVTIQLIWAHFL